MQDPSIVRNRLKIESTVANARATLAVQKEFGSLDSYLWSLVGGVPAHFLIGRHSTDIPAETAVSRELSKNLKRRGLPGSSVRPSATRSCRPPAWSMGT